MLFPLQEIPGGRGAEEELHCQHLSQFGTGIFEAFNHNGKRWWNSPLNFSFFRVFFLFFFFGLTENRKMEPALVQFRLIGFNTGSWRRHLRWHPLPICCLGWWWVGGCYCCWRMTSEMCHNLRNCVTGNWQGLDREGLWWRVSFFLQKCLILKTTEKVLFADSMELQKKLWDRNLCWNHDKSIGLLIFHSRNSNFRGDLNSITQHFMKFSRYKKTLKNHGIKLPIMQFILHFNLFLNQHLFKITVDNIVFWW